MPLFKSVVAMTSLTNRGNVSTELIFLEQLLTDQRWAHYWVECWSVSTWYFIITSGRLLHTSINSDYHNGATGQDTCMGFVVLHTNVALVHFTSLCEQPAKSNRG